MLLPSVKLTVPLACICAAAAAIIALLVTHWDPLATLDLAISNTFQKPRGDTLDRVAIATTSFADAIVLAIANVFLVILLLVARQFRLALASGFVMIGTFAAVEIIKSLVQRARPLVDLYDGNSAFSFPSGHTTNATAMLLVLIWLAWVSVGSAHAIRGFAEQLDFYAY